MKQTKRQTNSGITLVALVITIIILLILAGITISSLFGENGIIKMTHRSKDEIERAAQEENETLEEIGMMIKDEKAPEDAVARIKDKYYTSLELAIDDVKENEKTKVFLVKNTKENVIIPNNKEIELYLNGHTQENAVEDAAAILIERKAAYWWRNYKS